MTSHNRKQCAMHAFNARLRQTLAAVNANQLLLPSSQLNSGHISLEQQRMQRLTLANRHLALVNSTNKQARRRRPLNCPHRKPTTPLQPMLTMPDGINLQELSGVQSTVAEVLTEVNLVKSTKTVSILTSESLYKNVSGVCSTTKITHRNNSSNAITDNSSNNSSNASSNNSSNASSNNSSTASSNKSSNVSSNNNQQQCGCCTSVATETSESLCAGVNNGAGAGYHHRHHYHHGQQQHQCQAKMSYSQLPIRQITVDEAQELGYRPILIEKPDRYTPTPQPTPPTMGCDNASIVYPKAVTECGNHDADTPSVINKFDTKALIEYSLNQDDSMTDRDLQDIICKIEDMRSRRRGGRVNADLKPMANQKRGNNKCSLHRNTTRTLCEHKQNNNIPDCSPPSPAATATQHIGSACDQLKNTQDFSNNTQTFSNNTQAFSNNTQAYSNDSITYDSGNSSNQCQTTSNSIAKRKRRKSKAPFSGVRKNGSRAINKMNNGKQSPPVCKLKYTKSQGCTQIFKFMPISFAKMMSSKNVSTKNSSKEKKCRKKLN